MEKWAWKQGQVIFFLGRMRLCTLAFVLSLSSCSTSTVSERPLEERDEVRWAITMRFHFGMSLRNSLYFVLYWLAHLVRISLCKLSVELSQSLH